jgi:hypothetical protein
MGCEKAARDAISGTKCHRVFADAKSSGFCIAFAFIAAKWVLFSTRSWRTPGDELSVELLRGVHLQRFLILFGAPSRGWRVAGILSL